MRCAIVAGSPGTFNAAPREAWSANEAPRSAGIISNFKTCNDPEEQGGFDTFQRSNLTLALRERDGIDIHV
jgi:hypothetical protein